MKPDSVAFAVVTAISLLLLGSGCFQDVKSDGQIWGQVADSRSGAPIESVSIYETVLAGPIHLPRERTLAGFTDVDGRFRFWTSGRDLYVVEAEKDGYLTSAPQWLRGGGEVNFVLDRIER